MQATEVQRVKGANGYSKPTIAMLGTAISVIEVVHNTKLHTQIEGLPGQRNAPAYDLDE